MPIRVNSTKKAVLNLSMQMSSASVLGMVIKIPFHTLMAAILGPVGYGLLRIASLIQRYSAYADLGMKYALSRQLPLSFEKGDEQECYDIAAIVWTWILLISFATLLILWMIYAFGFSFQGLLTLPNLLLISLLILVGRLNTYFQNFAKGYGLFDVIGKNSFINEVLRPFVIFPLVLWLHVTGALLGQLLISILVGMNFLRHITKNYNFSPKIMLPWIKTKAILKLSLLLYANVLSEGLLESLGLTLLALFASVDEVGQLSYAISMVVFGTNITAGANLVVYRRMLQTRAQQRAQVKYEDFRHYMEGPLVTYLLFSSVALGFAYFSYEVVVRLFLPEFWQAILLAQVLAVGLLIKAITLFFRHYFNATDQLRSRLTLLWAGLGITFAFHMIFLTLGYGGMGIALGMVLGYGTYAFLLMISSARQIYGCLRIGVILLLKFFLISLFLGSCLHVLTNWHPFPLAASTMYTYWFIEFAFWGGRIAVYSAITLLLYSLFFRQYHPEREVLGAIQYVISIISRKFHRKSFWAGIDR